MQDKNVLNILIIKPGAMGDLLQMTPVFRALKNKIPQARISVLVGNRASTELFRHNPLIHETIVFDRRGEHHSLSALFKLWQRLRGSHYDTVLNFQRSNLKSWFLASAAFPSRILVYNKARRRIVHAVVNHLETLGGLGINPSEVKPCLELFLGEKDVQYAQELFGLNGFAGKTVVAINPGASHPVNRWGAEKFALLADKLAEQLSVNVIIVGGREDEPLATEIVSTSRTKPLVLTGKTDLLQLGAVLKRCALLVSGDTGPMHMATAVGTRVVALFGAADPARTGPVGTGHRVVQASGVECIPCRSRRCTSDQHLQCMEKITVEQVFDVIASMLAEGGESCES